MFCSKCRGGFRFKCKTKSVLHSQLVHHFIRSSRNNLAHARAAVAAAMRRLGRDRRAAVVKMHSGVLMHSNKPPSRSNQDIALTVIKLHRDPGRV